MVGSDQPIAALAFATCSAGERLCFGNGPAADTRGPRQTHVAGRDETPFCNVMVCRGIVSETSVRMRSSYTAPLLEVECCMASRKGRLDRALDRLPRRGP